MTSDELTDYVNSLGADDDNDSDSPDYVEYDGMLHRLLNAPYFDFVANLKTNRSPSYLRIVERLLDEEPSIPVVVNRGGFRSIFKAAE